jgi:hypothetical protein
MAGSDLPGLERFDHTLSRHAANPLVGLNTHIIYFLDGDWREILQDIHHRGTECTEKFRFAQTQMNAIGRAISQQQS